ncbi:TPA: phage tail protein [Citrobacter youngae]|uniref:phage tail protein n=1 Tax=Citrobacter sp. FDAARGOS_156 TaxID=1702170 RepID=UPI0018FF528C|nr:phage tail protein [Citrobacter sp. FDAARGOS_156]HEF0123289.1 phage tail protein [Citrobacter youngae]
MATKYFALLTNIGVAKLAKATALGAQVEITQMAVGDGNGALPTPNPAQTALTHEQRRAQLNMLTIDPVNTNQIIAEQVIPEDVGGWWIREVGLFDKDGDMIAVANCAETYKPQLQEGSGRVQVIRVILIVSSTEAVTLKIDPAVVLATRKYVDSAVIEVKAYTDNTMKKHVDAANPHSQYPLIENALKELADAGLVGEVLKNLGLRESISESGSFQLGDFQIVWGRGSTGSNGTGNVQFQRAFVDTPYLVMPSDISSGPEGVNAVGWDLSNSTAAGARIFSADSKSSGIATTFSYIAIGKGVV